jgi:hypothetical protein
MASSFVKKLFEMVEHEDNGIICWVGQGQAFEVLDPKRLEAEVLPKFFRHSRFQSLVRQLNFYAFKKVSKERSSWVYSHECFVAGRPDLLDHLKRKTNGSAMDMAGGGGGGGGMSMIDRQPNLILSVGCGSYDTEDTSFDSPLDESRKRALSTTSSSDFQFLPSDEDHQVASCDWNEVDDETTGTDSFSNFKTNSLKYVTSAPDLASYRTHSGSMGGVAPSTSSGRKKMRRSYSMGEVDNTAYDTDINFEDILSNWNSVQKFFLNKPGNESEETQLPTPTPTASFANDDKDERSIKEDGDSTVESTNVDGLVRFCLEKDPWQRSNKLCADIQDLLASNVPLESEMAAYSAALAPPPLTLRAVVDSRFAKQRVQQQIQTEDNSSDTDSERQPLTINVTATQSAPHTPRVRMVVQRVPLMSPRCKLTQEVFGETTSQLPDRKSLSPLPHQRPSREIETVRTFLAFSLACLHSAAAKEQDKAKHSSLQFCADKWGEYAQCCL